jgi:hypothetical protein
MTYHAIWNTNGKSWFMDAGTSYVRVFTLEADAQFHLRMSQLPDTYVVRQCVLEPIEEDVLIEEPSRNDK